MSYNLLKISDDPLHGTITPHQCYILLHSSRPISEFVSKHTTPVQRALQLRATQWGGLVNFTWYGQTPPKEADGRGKVKQPATAFTVAGGRLEIPDISLENMDDVEQQLKAHIEGPIEKMTSEEIHIYVCTHGARDCRCGNIGSQVVQALRREKGAYQQQHPRGLASRIKIGEVSHVGGHKFAANMIMLPHGEWFGRMKPEDASMVIRDVCNRPVTPLGHSPPLIPHHWRGRLGHSKSQTTELWDTYIKSGNAK
ncbi:Sucrase/ferredoxin-like-domain-containing protein [Crassisporium funariophilum]|nr:Sucrase/ferredoxin-like-domain-containing protein [Crassisporium funariophilum]